MNDIVSKLNLPNLVELVVDARQSIEALAYDIYKDCQTYLPSEIDLNALFKKEKKEKEEEKKSLEELDKAMETWKLEESVETFEESIEIIEESIDNIDEQEKENSN